MRKTKTFDAYGVRYRITQMAATEGLARLIDPPDKVQDPLGTLEAVRAHVFDATDGQWVSLADAAAVDRYVQDEREDLAPFAQRVRPGAVLADIMEVISNHNFAFANGMAFVKFPKHLQGTSIDWEPPTGVNAILVTLIGEKHATLQQLEEYYSVEDAYIMYNILASNSLRGALSHEAAVEKAREEAKVRR